MTPRQKTVIDFPTWSRFEGFVEVRPDTSFFSLARVGRIPFYPNAKVDLRKVAKWARY